MEPTPNTPATNTAASELLTPKQRSIVYVASAMFAAAYGVIEANANLSWPVMALYAAWNAGVGLLAVSNTRR